MHSGPSGVFFFRVNKVLIESEEGGKKNSDPDFLTGLKVMRDKQGDKQ